MYVNYTAPFIAYLLEKNVEKITANKVQNYCNLRQ